MSVAVLAQTDDAPADDTAPVEQDAGSPSEDRADAPAADEPVEPSDQLTPPPFDEEEILRELREGLFANGLDGPPFELDLDADGPAEDEAQGFSFEGLLDRFEPGPDAPVEQRLAWLFAELKAAPTSDEAAFVSEEIEALWSDVGDPTAELLTQRAQAAASNGRFILARRLADGAVSLAETSADAWVTSSAIALADDDIVRAISDLEQALALEPRRYDALLTLASLFEGLENWRGAYDAYEDVLEIYPQLPYAQERLEAVRVRAQGREL